MSLVGYKNNIMIFGFYGFYGEIVLKKITFVSISSWSKIHPILFKYFIFIYYWTLFRNNVKFWSITKRNTTMYEKPDSVFEEIKNAKLIEMSDFKLQKYMQK